MSITATGVPYSRAIFVARGVVIDYRSISATPSLRAKRSNPSHSIKKEWIASSLCSAQ
jgi:hypothetical protein